MSERTSIWQVRRLARGGVAAGATLTPSTNRLYAATNLAPPVSWQPVCTNVTGGLWRFTDTNAIGNPAKFYRLSTP